jgi:hypothetical protein
MCVCDPPLVAELSAVASNAVRRRDAAPLQAFLARHADRRAIIDAFRVPLDVARLAQARDALAPYAEHAAAAAFVNLAMALSPLPRTVGKTAQTALFNRTARVVRLIEIDAPSPVLETELQYANAALAALDTADLSIRNARAGLGLEPWEGALVRDCLDLCAVPGREEDIGLGELWALWMDKFIAGPPLVDVPGIREDEDPSPDLLGRVVERFGYYGAGEACEVLVEDWLRFCSTFTYYSPPVWGAGAALQEAAASARHAGVPADEDERDEDDLRVLDERLRELARDLDEAAVVGYAVVEWVENW